MQSVNNKSQHITSKLHILKEMEKIGWDGHEFPQSLLPTANFPCLPVPPFLLLPVQNVKKKGNCCHHFSHKIVDIEGIQEEQDIVHIHQGGRTDDLSKTKFIIMLLLNNCAPGIPLRNSITPKPEKRLDLDPNAMAKRRISVWFADWGSSENYRRLLVPLGDVTGMSWPPGPLRLATAVLQIPSKGVG